jgi:hypothetical protein
MKVAGGGVEFIDENGGGLARATGEPCSSKVDDFIHTGIRSALD